MASSCENLLGLVQLLRQLHEERAQCYHMFEEGHKIYLSTSPNYEFEKFRALVHDITDEFKRISDEIILIEKRVRSEFNDSELADLVEHLQDDEKHKLELTAKLQLTKQNVIDYPDEPERELDVMNLKQSLREVVERINDHIEEFKYKEKELS